MVRRFMCIVTLNAMVTTFVWVIISVSTVLADGPEEWKKSKELNTGIEETIAGIEKCYQGVETIRARFTQHQKIKMTGSSTKATGTFFYKRPNLLRWDYEAPEVQQIILDGTHLWMYQPAENQVYKQTVGDVFLSMAPAVFFSGVGGLTGQFDVSLKSKTDEELQLEMTPKAENTSIRPFVVILDTASFMMRAVVSTDALGNRSTMRFEGIESNKELSDSLFRFTVPEGSEVIDMSAAGLGQ